MRIFVTALLISAFAPLAFSQELSDILAPETKAVVLGTGYGFCEGPAVDPVGNIYFSDGAKDSIHFYPYNRPVQLFTDKSTDANGMMFNNKGELLVCEGAAYHVVAFNTLTGEKRELIRETDLLFEGLRFNEPNDLTVDKEDGFYFTDPNYGHRKQETVRKQDVYYVDKDGKVSRVSTVCKQPNGVLLSADAKTLYVADCHGKQIFRYKVAAPGKLEDETMFIDLGAHPDGMTQDVDGNLYIACGGNGVKIYTPEGKHIGTLGRSHGVPSASNCVFGGPGMSILYITASDKFIGIQTKTKGIGR